MFCSPSSSKSDIINRKYESNNNYDNDFQNSCYSNTKYQNNHDQINGQNTIEHLNNLNTSKQFDIKNHKNKNNNEPEFKIFTDFKSQNIIQNNCDNINERKYTNENENEYDNKKKFEKTKDKEIERNYNDNDNYKGDDSYSNRLSLEIDDINNMNNITSRKGSMDSLTSESLNLNFAWAGDNVHVHTLGASTNELSVIKEVNAVLSFSFPSLFSSSFPSPNSSPSPPPSPSPLPCFFFSSFLFFFSFPFFFSLFFFCFSLPIFFFFFSLFFFT